MELPTMRFRSLLPNPFRAVLYATELRFQSSTTPGVTFTLRRMSAAGRLDLISRLGSLVSQLEMLRASEDLPDRLQAEALRIQIDREYLLWGLKDLQGLRIDDEAADAMKLFECGPEGLVNEIVQRIRSECELDANARKN